MSSTEYQVNETQVAEVLSGQGMGPYKRKKESSKRTLGDPFSQKVTTRM